MSASIVLIPLFTYAVGVTGVIALYFLAISGIALLYAAQVFLTRSASLPRGVASELGAPYSVAGKHVLITGGSQGIGYAIALETVKRGASIVTLVARNAGPLQAAQSACVEKADTLNLCVKVQTITADLLDSKKAVECLDTAVALKVRQYPT